MKTVYTILTVFKVDTAECCLLPSILIVSLKNEVLLRTLVGLLIISMQALSQELPK